jgi:YVTN family beta-propeller protein
MHPQHKKALRPALGAGAGFLLTSGLLVAAVARPAAATAGAPAQASGHVYVTNQLGDTVSVIDAQTDKVTATVPAGTAPEGIAVSPDRRRLYIADSGSARISVLTASNAITTTVRSARIRPASR